MSDSGLDAPTEKRSRRDWFEYLTLAAIMAVPLMFLFSLLELFGTTWTPFIRGGGGFGWPFKFGAIGIFGLGGGYFHVGALLMDTLLAFAVLVIVLTFTTLWKSKNRIAAVLGFMCIIFACSEFVQAMGDFRRIAENRQRWMESCRRVCDANSDGACNLADWELLKPQYRDAAFYRCEQQSAEIIARLDADGNGCIDSQDPWELKLYITGSVSSDEIVEIYQPKNP